MVRLTIRLTELQSKMLREMARDQGVSMSELVRRGVDMALSHGIANEETRRRAKESVGFIKDNPDVSVNHDCCLAESSLRKLE